MSAYDKLGHNALCGRWVNVDGQPQKARYKVNDIREDRGIWTLLLVAPDGRLVTKTHEEVTLIDPETRP